MRVLVDWNTPGPIEDYELPAEVDTEDDISEDFITAWLEEEYGYAVYGWEKSPEITAAEAGTSKAVLPGEIFEGSAA